MTVIYVEHWETLGEKNYVDLLHIKRLLQKTLSYVA